MNIVLTDAPVSDDTQMNIFLQKWKGSTHHKSKLLLDLKRMLKCAERYNAKFEAIKLSENQMNSLLAWHHVGVKTALQHLTNSAHCVCLHDNHKAHTVSNLIGVTK